MTLTFLVIQCRSSFKGILGRSFLARLDVVASTIHMKITYHYEEGILITVGVDLQVARRINRIILKNIMALASKSSDKFELDTHEDKVRYLRQRVLVHAAGREFNQFS